MIMSACMMLDYLGEKSISQKIQNAIAKVVEEGKVQCYDMKKMRGTPEVVKQGAASTKQMADAIIAKL